MCKIAAKAILIVLLLCGIASASEQAAEGESNIFGGSLADAIFTVAAFLLLLVVLGKYAWKPVLSVLKQREDHIRGQIESAEASFKKAQKLMEEHKAEGVKIIEQASEQARRLEETITERTQMEVMLMKRKAQEEIEQARDAAKEELWSQAGEIVTAISKKVLDRTVNEEDDKRLINEAVGELKEKQQR